MKIGIIREEKFPRDSRVPLTPSQCKFLTERNPDIQVVVQPCKYRCFTNEEFIYQGVALQEDLSDCDVLLGVKEVPVDFLLAGKTYVFFSHVIKKQPHNRKMLQHAIKHNIRLIDWECMKDKKGKRVIAFGRWAGIVGAYHAIRMIGFRTSRFRLRQMIDCLNFAEAQKELEKLDLPNWKIVLTGTGRVSEGAAFMLDVLGIKKVSPYNFCYNEFEEPVYTQLASADMYHREGFEKFDADDYHLHPQEYKSNFYPFTKAADVMINGIYWDKRIPVFFTKEQMREKDFRIKIISDITCDVAPDSSVPSTLYASSIADPYYGYNANTGELTQTFQPESLDVMAIDNLPNELPRDASEDFGNMIISRIIPQLQQQENSEMIHGATIARNGSLNEPYKYLADYVADGLNN
ncbi:MAG: alanine dehydrogenase [Chitinophagales bacterium]|nr:alanine dehydrogenase [Chitinophagales bacterium]